MANLLNQLRPTSGKREVICPKCLSHIIFNDDTQLHLISETYEVEDPDTQKMVERNGGCPAPIHGTEDQLCGYVFPLRYLQNSPRANPFFVNVFGWSGHGKTVFLDVLRLMLFDMRTVWPKYVHQTLSEKDMEYDRDLRRYQLHGYIPEATQDTKLSEIDPLILQLDNMVPWGSRTMIVMDQAGERFDKLDGVPVDQIPFLQHTPTAFMLISLPQILNKREGRSVDQLLNIYIETILRIETQVQHQNNQNNRRQRRLKRKLVVVFTMADIIPNLPMHLRQYVTSDDMWTQLRRKGVNHMDSIDMAAYIERMQWVNDEIIEWLQRDTDGVPGGSNFVGLIENSDFEARYTLISATGHDDLRERPKTKQDEENTQGIQITPRRVLDPFFWAMELQGK